MTPLQYRYLRKQIPLPATTNGVMLEARVQSTWSAIAPNEKYFQDLLVVRGELQDKASRYKVEWLFDLTVPIWTEFRDHLSHFQHNNSYSAKTEAIELEVSFEIEWLKVGIIRKQDNTSAYLEFSRAGQVVRAEYSELKDLYELRSALAPMFSV